MRLKVTLAESDHARSSISIRLNHAKVEKRYASSVAIGRGYFVIKHRIAI
jgi:hypothetical protein